MDNKILVTGAGGFIGHSISKILLKEGCEVVGLDNLNDYYSVNLKYGRLADLGIEFNSTKSNTLISSDKYENFKFIKLDINDIFNLNSLFEAQEFTHICHLAAQAGVRYSIENPRAYIDSNISGFLNILELSRIFHVKHLVYASSSSVYGLNQNVPYSEESSIAHPVSLYAATKKSNELMAHAYSSLYQLPTTGLRFFTVYGPWGRPDMSPILFANAIFDEKVLNVFNEGDMLRDFTFIDDIVEGVKLAIFSPPNSSENWDGQMPDPSSSSAPYKVYNIGNSKPVKLMDFISNLERAFGKVAPKNFLPMQPGDVYQTNADVSKIMEDLGYSPKTEIHQGIEKFVEWYLDYYRKNK